LNYTTIRRKRGQRHFAVIGPHLPFIRLPLSTGNDLTGGDALPMFASAWMLHHPLLEGKKAFKSSGYHESGTGGIARQSEDNQ
jgi:hypothetical protein